MRKPNAIIHVKKAVINNQLLTALDDKSKVGLVLDETDLTLLIEALGALMKRIDVSFVDYTMSERLKSDLIELKEAAFQ